jgi:hypothetical protein
MAIPDNRKDLESFGYEFNGEGTCRGCGAELLWFITPREKKMPFSRIADSGPSDDSEKLEPHWGVCSARDQFRRPK